MQAANIKLIDLTGDRLKFLTPVTSLDMMDGASDNFHPAGLFSIPIFGRVGSDERDTRFSYIDVKVRVLHPFVYKALVKIKGLYAGIMSGKSWATWDNNEKDFVQSDEVNGETGYYFFFKHWKDIVFKSTGSDIRDVRISMIEKYKKVAEYDKILVIPAGLRDAYVDESGKKKEGEINDIYRTIIGVSNALHSGIESPLADTSRNSLQNAFNALFEYLNGLIEGKRGFLQDKWAKRRVFHATRNVITAMDTSVEDLNQLNAPGPNDTIVGIYQFAKSIEPLIRYELSSGWLSKVFGTAEGKSIVVNKNTLKSEAALLSVETVDRWTKTDGLDKVIGSLSEPSLRGKPIVLEDKYYLGLMYLGPDSTFRIFGDIDELPAYRDRKDVYPLSLVALIYVSGYREWYKKTAAYVCRYPISTDGSIYPCKPYVKTTVIGDMRWELDENWQRIGDDHIALEFPRPGMDTYVESLVPHISKIKGMAADYDGDTAAYDAVYSIQSVKEVDDYFKSRKAYVNANNGLRASCFNDTVKYVTYNLTAPA